MHARRGENVLLPRNSKCYTTRARPVTITGFMIFLACNAGHTIATMWCRSAFSCRKGNLRRAFPLVVLPCLFVVVHSSEAGPPATACSCLWGKAGWDLWDASAMISGWRLVFHPSSNNSEKANVCSQFAEIARWLPLCRHNKRIVRPFWGSAHWSW